MSQLIKKRGKFTKWLRRRDIKKLYYVEHRQFASYFDATTIVFVNRKQWFTFSKYIVNTALGRVPFETFYAQLYKALEQVRGKADHDFEERYDHEDDSFVIMFYGVWCYESDLLVILKAMKYEYGDFMLRGVLE